MLPAIKPELKPATLTQIQSARERIAGLAIRTPLIPLYSDNLQNEVYLKLENFQAIGSFKVRPAASVIRNFTEETLNNGLFTASSGNFGIGASWVANKLGLQMDVVMPDNAPVSKRNMLKSLGADLHIIPFDQWWQVINSHTFSGLSGTFVDGVGDMQAIAGNGTIGLEIIEQMPDVDIVMAPFGGGGLISGIASAVRAVKPETSVIACESEAAQPLTAAIKNDGPLEVPCTSSFISGMGVNSVLPWMWPVVRELLDSTVVVSLSEVIKTMKLLAERNRVVVEGAGAVSVAAAINSQLRGKKIVCIISGGNIDSIDFIDVLHGKIPDRY